MFREADSLVKQTVEKEKKSEDTEQVGSCWLGEVTWEAEREAIPPCLGFPLSTHTVRDIPVQWFTANSGGKISLL